MIFVNDFIKEYGVRYQHDCLILFVGLTVIILLNNNSGVQRAIEEY